MVFTPSEQAITMGFFKKIDGVWHKRCTGPSHDGFAWLPTTEKYFYIRKKREIGDRHGQLTSRCRLCHNYATAGVHGVVGLVEVYKVRHFYDEAVNRIGLIELSRRTGLDRSGLYLVLSGKVQHVRLANFRKVMLELISIRRKGEFSSGGQSRNFAVRRASGSMPRCGECGTPTANITYGCVTCQDRQTKRERRAA